jgi:hypothetical protein
MDRFALENAILKVDITDDLWSVVKSIDNGDPPEVTRRLLDVFIDLSTIRNAALWDTFCQVYELDKYSPYAKKEKNS